MFYTCNQTDNFFLIEAFNNLLMTRILLLYNTKPYITCFFEVHP